MLDDGDEIDREFDRPDDKGFDDVSSPEGESFGPNDPLELTSVCKFRTMLMKNDTSIP